VPIVPDEARTFGMEGMFRQIGIYSSMGQLYTPQDADSSVLQGGQEGQILEEGINEAGSMCSWIAAGTAYSNHGVNMVPFYLFYSMFGFQRIGDFCWAAGDMRSRGFLIGGTAGRTTLAGRRPAAPGRSQPARGSTIPNCVAYDPCYAYELAVIVQAGLKRMFQDQEHVFYYITCMNENYAHPALPKGVEEGILRGMYLLHIGKPGKVRVNLLGSGTILREVLARRSCSRRNSACRRTCSASRASRSCAARRSTSSAGTAASRRPSPHALREPVSAGHDGPFVAATDYMRTVPDQVRQWVPGAITCSARTASDAAIRARRCAASSRSIGATSRLRR
jgi:pyruvate dehydrogenase E1 component